MSAHAPIAPSALHRHMRCPGALAAEDGLPDTQTFAAAEGTLAHDYAARILKGEGYGDAEACASSEAARQAARFGHAEPVIDDGMRAHVANYVDLVRSLVEPGDTLMVEQRVKIVPLVWGTADVIILPARSRRITTVDLKYGFIPVRVEGNEQLQAYNLGAFKRYDGLVDDYKTARGIIYQPRNGGESSATWKRRDILAFEKTLVKAVRACIDPHAPRIASKKGCQWCKAKPTCREHKIFTEALKAPAFEDTTTLQDKETYGNQT